MYKEILKLKFVNVKNCFLQFSPKTYNNLSSHGLVVKAALSGGKELYFSVNTVNSLENWEVGISSTYANLLDLKENDVLVITPLNNIGSVRKIYAKPATQDDFDILAVNSDVVESSLLNQLKVVWPKQAFPVWISPSVSITLVVDSLAPELECARLEEYSEIDIGDVENNKSAKTPNENTSNLDHCPKALVFRSIPLESESILKCPDPEKYKYHPYNVYLNLSVVPSWLESLISENNVSLWSLEKYGTRNVPRTPTNEEGEDEGGLTVRLCVKDEFLVGHDIGRYPSLFVSKAIRACLKLKQGEKVVLKHLPASKRRDVLGILVTPCFDIEAEAERKELEEKLYKHLLHLTLNSGSVLLNTKAPFPLDETNVVSLTLRPLDIRWTLLTLGAVKDVRVTINFIKSERDINSDESAEPCEEITNKIPSFENLLKEACLSVDITLGLSLGLKDCYSNNFCDNLLVTGKSGSGKKTLVNLLLQKFRAGPFYIHCETIDCSFLKGKRMENLNKILIDSLTACENYQPSVLALLNIACIAGVPKPDHEKTEASFHMKRVSYKIAELLEQYQNNNAIFVVATAESKECVNPRLFSPRGKSTFMSQIVIPELLKTDRLEYLSQILNENSSVLPESVDLDKISTLTDSYVARDLLRFADKVRFEAWQRKAIEGGQFQIRASDLEAALEANRPAALESLNLNKGSNLKFSNVGGLYEAKEKLIQIILWPSMYPEIMGQCPLKQQNAALLYGVPGCGKTLLASAVAGESKLNFITVKGPELMSKYIGESEEGVRKLFERAQAAKPCLLFFDEFDSLAPRRGKDQTGVTDRVVNQLLTALDGVEPMTGVLVLAASSRPDLIDPALLRPGRIGTSIYLDLPSLEDRLEILEKICKDVALAEDVDLKEVAKRTVDFSGADLKGLITSAQIKILDCYVRIPDGETTGQSVFENVENETLQITQQDILDLLENTKPALSPKEKQRYEMIYERFTSKSIPDISSQKVTFA